jgi:hypothetical protein
VQHNLRAKIFCVYAHEQAFIVAPDRLHLPAEDEASP